ncbi:protein of unknown function DUF81 [Desulfovibrio sp. X2]|uniref:TSUP family transporter n=1 Tax=Desulfovibrio sp. X2 TaxID=941449 RepID=UPI00035881A8|nr:TSUP family transporter [Desulfovibrio sp. X2]EPR44557.1 protein of unknown function DUF81 [Desulfovibrio sp. X2]
MTAAGVLTLGLASGLAGFTQGFGGFGSTLVALPLLGMVFGMRAAVPLGCLMALTLNVFLATRHRSHVRRPALLLLLAAALPGMALGAALIGHLPEALLKSLLGAALLLLAGQSLRTGLPATPAGTGWAAAAGFVSGCLGMCIGVNGPPVIAWTARQPWPREALKATLTTYFLLAGIGIVGTQALSGLVTRPVLGLYAAALAPLLGGLWAGEFCCGKLDDQTFRRIVLLLVGAMGALLLCQAGAGLLAR